MWKLRNYLKPYWKSFVLAPCFMVFEVLFDLLLPKFVADLVDNGVVKHDFQIILHTGAIMVLTAFLGLIAGVGCNFFASHASQNFGADIREAAFTKVQSFSFENLDTFKTGSLITRMTNDVTQVQNLLRMGMQTFIRTPGLLVGSIIMAIIMSPRLGLILLQTILLLAVVLTVLIRHSFPIFSHVQLKLDAVNTRLQENLAGIRVVKAFVRSLYETKLFEQANRDYAQTSIKASLVIALNYPVVNLIMNACLVGIVYYGGNLVWAKSMPVGNLVAFVNYVTQALSALLNLSSILVNVSQATVSVKRIQQVLSTRPDIEDSETAQPFPIQGWVVEFDHVSFSYRREEAETEVLRDISFTAHLGETIAIIGPTGSGKSTLVQLIPRLYDVSSGSIRIDGKDIREIPLLDLRRHIGMVLQESFLFTGTISENIAFGKPDATPEEIEAAAKIAQAHDFISGLPDGYRTQIGQKGINLSGGQKQRLSIARALLVRPPILILDDSTSALDLGTEKEIRDGLKEVMKKSITFLIAQRISSVRSADQILVLEDGKIAGRGTHEKLMETSRVYQEIYDSQFGRKEAHENAAKQQPASR